MGKGLFDDIPISNPARDKSWESFIKRKDVKEFFEQQTPEFRFPLEGGWYELWCFCWARAWDAGWESGYDSGSQVKKEDGMDTSLDLLNGATNCKPLAWVLIDRTTDELVSICLIEPKDGWLSECYEVVPLYAFREVKK